jgi:hypothetical protein
VKPLSTSARRTSHIIDFRTSPTITTGAWNLGPGT